MTKRSFDDVKKFLKDNYMWVNLEITFKEFKKRTDYPGTLHDLFREEGENMARVLWQDTICRKEVWAEYTAAYEAFCGLHRGPRYRVATRKRLICVVENVVSEEEAKDLIKMARTIDNTAFYSRQIAGTNNYEVFGIEKYLERI